MNNNQTTKQSNINNINNTQFGSIYETKMINNIPNINNSIPNNIQISTQQSNRIVSSSHQSKPNQSNANNQNIRQVKSGYNNNVGNIMQKNNNNYNFALSNILGNNMAKTALPQNPFALNQKGSELPTLEEKIMKSTAEIFK